ncbi:MOP flippase family protein [Psychroflexus lacisalsi]|uniref:Lipopolysaccharide biosynthesis protein n=1 Tax=Psychroflexus lacisalsi TaxID=503928 RepID=A0ABN1K3X0_9FLAO|nr:MOP flippase family protein [Psychroflexus lacisalsi]MBZ9618846.1 MOP flippase family protein [Psychroflexus lacisalsi]
MVDKGKHKKDTISGIKWTVLDQVISQGVTFGLGILLMSIIVPREFGLLGMVTVFSGFLSVFKDFGLGSSLIQKKEIEKKEIDTIYWTTVGLGLFLTILLIVLSPVIAKYYDEPLLFEISLSLSFLFILQSFSSVQMSLAKKKMKFKLIFQVHTIAVVISGVIALFLAYSGFGVWALVIQQITAAFLSSVAFYILSNYKPKLFWDKKTLKPHINFSLPLVGMGSINYWSRNADNFFIGKFLGAELLGIYSRSYSIMMLPVGRISGVLSSVLFPSLSLIQDDSQRVTSIFLKITRAIAFVTFPLMAMLALGAKDFVNLILGDEWSEMIPILQILASVGALQSLATLNGNIFLVKNRTDLAFKINMFNSAVYVIGFYFSSQYNLISVALIYLISNVLLMLINWYLVENILQIKFLTLTKNVWFILVNYMVVLGIGHYGIGSILKYLEFTNLINLIIILFYVTLLWLGMFIIFKKSSLEEYLKLIKEAVKK